MSEVPKHLPPPSNPALLPILATATYLAALVALWGATSLMLDRDVVDYPDAGPLLGPAMAAAGCAVTWACLWWIARGGPWSLAAAALAGTFGAMVIVGAAGYALTRGSLSWLILAAGNLALSPFVVGGAVLSGATALALRASRR
jgi:hypothetical protein